MAISLSTAVSGKKEPKRGNRFILKFSSVPKVSTLTPVADGSDDAPTSLAIDLVSASRPSLNFSSDTVKRMNETWNFATAPTWEAMNVIFNDFDKGPASASKLLWDWSQAVYNVLDGTMGYAAGYKTDASLMILGPGQTKTHTTNIEALETWDLFGIYPDSVQWGALSYEGTEILKVSVTFRFDYANLQSTNTTVQWA